MEGKGTTIMGVTGMIRQKGVLDEMADHRRAIGHLHGKLRNEQKWMKRIKTCFGTEKR